MDEAKANTRLIVTAVNAYEPLVAALRIIAEFPFTDPKNMDAENMAAIARAALEKRHAD